MVQDITCTIFGVPSTHTPLILSGYLGGPMAKVLVVDDEEQIRVMTRHFLERLGHEVLVASNGSEGLYLIQSETPDLVISDLQMPVMNGDEMLVKAGFFRAIVASGKFSWLPTDADKVREFPMLNALIGRVKFVDKPFRFDLLKALMSEILNPEAP